MRRYRVNSVGEADHLFASKVQDRRAELKVEGAGAEMEASFEQRGHGNLGWVERK